LRAELEANSGALSANETAVPLVLPEHNTRVVYAHQDFSEASHSEEEEDDDDVASRAILKQQSEAMMAHAEKLGSKKK
jgi:hypothetical protein